MNKFGKIILKYVKCLRNEKNVENVEINCENCVCIWNI